MFHFCSFSILSPVTTSLLQVARLLFCATSNFPLLEWESFPFFSPNLKNSAGLKIKLRKRQINKKKTFFFFSCLFLGSHMWHMEVPRRGVEMELSRQSTPQVQQHQSQASAATCTIAHGNTRSLTHWAKPGIEPASSWILVGFITAEPWWKLPEKHIWVHT